MIELGETTVTWGMVALAFAIGSIAVWTVWRQPRAVGTIAVLVAAIHGVAHGTAYLDAEGLASVRETAVELVIDAFVVVAGALDVVFATIGRAIAWVLDALAGVTMPETTSVSVLEFVSFLLGVVLVTMVVCGALVGIVRRVGAEVGGWLAGFGVVFGALGILWTWLPVGIAEITALHGLLVVTAVGAGAAITVVATGASPTLVMRERVRAYR